MQYLSQFIKVYIKGCRSKLHIKDYRPISLTNVFCNTIERIIHSKIMSHTESEALFLLVRLALDLGYNITQLTNAQTHIIDCVNQRYCVDGVLLDLI